MNKFIFQPTSNALSRLHYEATIKNPISLTTIKDYLSTDFYGQLSLQYPDGQVRVWGIMNGENNVNKKKWEKITRGDITLFSAKGGIISSAVTTMTLHSKELAAAIWGTDDDGNTWENIYFVKDLKNITIPYSVLNPLLGYHENYVIQGFNILDQEKSQKLNFRFELFSNEVSEEVTDAQYQKAVQALSKQTNLNEKAQTYRRIEQSFLRKTLFGNRASYPCGICGKELPCDLLVTAHIKKRCECTDAEKLDYRHIVMPMCKLGCDDLYEKGYLCVQDGHIRINPHKWATGALQEKLAKLDGRKCEYYNENTKGYFETHRRKFGL